MRFFQKSGRSIAAIAAGKLALLMVLGCGLNFSGDSARAQLDFWAAMDPIAPIKAPFDMPQLERPDFPDRVVDIRDHGAVGDGTTKNTEAFKAAIAACADAGGGHVLVPEGKWYTGPIHLKSNIDLHLAEGSEIIFSDVFADYLPVVPVRVGGIDLYNYSTLIYAKDCENIAVTGTGKLNGNAEKWWAWSRSETRRGFEMGAAGVPMEERVFGREEDHIRPSFVTFYNCKNILMEGFTIGGGPNWTIHPIYSDNIIIRRVHVLTEGPNNDGIDPDSCRNMLIEHCVFDTGDDCVVLKSGYNEDGRRRARPTENIVMRHCSSKRGHGGLVIGSEMSGDVRNVYMHDCEFEGTDRAVRLKTRADRGGVVENVWAHDLNVKNMQREVVILNMDYGADRQAINNVTPPVFRNINVWDVNADGAPTAILIRGMADSPIYNISFSDMNMKTTKGIVIENARDIEIGDINLTTDNNPAFELTNASDIEIEDFKWKTENGIFLKLSGDKSGGIEIEDVTPGVKAAAIQLENGATMDMVEIDD